jgi:O-antigen ligase
LGRAQENLLDASGRLELWNGAWTAFQELPLFGWGPGVYGTLFEPGGVPAHSWVLEILAGVGLLGALVFFPLILRAYLGGVPLWRRSEDRAFGTQSKVWNATTALAIMPSMFLSTHQWNVWAWAVIGLWTCSLALDDPDDRSEKVRLEAPSSSRRRFERQV